MEYSQMIRLKNGKSCCLRSGTESDGQAVCDNMRLTREETDYLLSYPDEISFTAAQEGKFLKEKSESANEAEILALVDGVVVGTAGIEAIGSQYKVQHRAEFGINIAKAYWGLGVGKALMTACVECARKANYTQLELSVVSENERAVRMYSNAGFVEYGRNPKGFRLRSGEYMEMIYMRLDL